MQPAQSTQQKESELRNSRSCHIRLEPLPDCLPSRALEYSSSTSYASSSSTTSAWGTDKGSENDTLKHVETSTTKHVPIHHP
ncbi:hypothetical protein FF1_012273 [Malus domestica]